MNINSVIEWIKGNVFIVIFCVLIIAAPIAMWFVSNNLNAQVRSQVNERVKQDVDLTRIEKTVLSTPDGSVNQPGIVNEAFLARYNEVANAMQADAQAVQKAALSHNHKNRTVVLSEVFPEIPPEKRDVLPMRFHEALVVAYKKLLAAINAGTPPTLQSLREELERTRAQFIIQDLRKDPNDKLEPDELNRLRENLANLRMSRYADAAENTTLYVSENELNVPAWNQEHQPSPSEMFTWQWQLWVTHDVLHALHEANKADQSVLRAPVKQILAIDISGLPGAGAPGDQFSGSGMGSGSRGFGGEVSGYGDTDTASASRAGMPANPKAPVPLDFAASFTGRKTNPLYDVVDVQLDLIVDSMRLPQVLDTLARYNFITVTSLTMTAVDAFDSAQAGYFYGPAPVARVTMNLETIWLREWTQKFMPKSVKQSLGLPIDQTPDPASPAA